MFGRIALAATLALTAVAGSAGCYDVPTPDCGFACGPEGACPDGYTCSDLDGRCHRDGAPRDLVCPAAEPPTEQPPAVIAASPAPDATDVPLDARLSAQFSEPVLNVSTSTFRVIDDATEAPVAGAITYDPQAEIATFTPSAPLAGSARYRITLTGGIADYTGTPLTGAPVSWTFTTVDTTAPRLISRIPAPGATGVAVDATLAIGFDEPVFNIASGWTLFQDATFVGGVIDVDPGLQQATYSPGLQLAAQTTYTVTVSGTIVDLAGNALADAPVAWTFTTGADTVAPQLRIAQPTFGDVGAPTDSVITVLFDEAVTGVDAASFLVDAGGPIAGTLASSQGGVGWTFTPTAPLPAGATVTVTLTTAITDLASNALAAPLTYSFMTAP